MTTEQLHEKINEAKHYLNVEMVKIRTTGEESIMNFREIGQRLDMIHEVERVGIRNLGENQVRKITRMLALLDEVRASQN